MSRSLEKLPEQEQGCEDSAVHWLLNSGRNLELQVLISLTQECESMIFSRSGAEASAALPCACPREAVEIKALFRKRALKHREEKELGCDRTHMVLLKASSQVLQHSFL